MYGRSWTHAREELLDLCNERLHVADPRHVVDRIQHDQLRSWNTARYGLAVFERLAAVAASV